MKNNRRVHILHSCDLTTRYFYLEDCIEKQSNFLSKTLAVLSRKGELSILYVMKCEYEPKLDFRKIQFQRPYFSICFEKMLHSCGLLLQYYLFV